jgi:glycosyltransferase involved in cell wall biosynthesis
LSEGASRPVTLLHVFSTFAVGGPQTRFVAIADGLGAKYRHLIASMSGRTEAAALLPAHVAWEPVPVRNIPGNPLANVRAYARQLRDLAPGALVTYNWGALEWAIANRFGPRLPHIHIEDGFGPDEAVKRFRRRIWLRRGGLKRTEAVIVPSRNLERIALEEWRLPRSQVTYLPNGIDLARFGAAPAEADSAFVRRPDELVVGTCAALRPEKNLARLVRVFAACGVANARLVICGAGAELAALRAAAEAAGIADKVVFTGFLARPERALCNFDVFAMSSDTEQMPLGLLEAMAAGLPAAATDVGDTKAMVAGANRQFIVPASDEAALARALAALLRDPALRASLGSANRLKAEREFALDQMIAAYDRLFQAVAEERRA